MMSKLRIFSYLPNPRLYKATIAARYSGAEIEVVGAAPSELVDWLWDIDARPIDPSEMDALAAYRRPAKTGFTGVDLYKTDAFLVAHPFGNVPAAFGLEDGSGIFESNSILRAAARLGPQGHTLLGSTPIQQSRVDSFLDRSLVFARDMQHYLLAGDTLKAQRHSDMGRELEAFASGLNRAFANSPNLVGDSLTIADIAVVCELCQMTNESRFLDKLAELGLSALVPTLKQFEHLGGFLTRISTDERFSQDLAPYFKRLLPVWD